MELRRQYIVDEDNQKVAVQLDTNTFEKIENVLENFGLLQLMNDDDSEVTTIENAKQFYATVKH